MASTENAGAAGAADAEETGPLPARRPEHLARYLEDAENPVRRAILFGYELCTSKMSDRECNSQHVDFVVTLCLLFGVLDSSKWSIQNSHHDLLSWASSPDKTSNGPAKQIKCQPKRTKHRDSSLFSFAVVRLPTTLAVWMLEDGGTQAYLVGGS